MQLYSVHKNLPHKIHITYKTRNEPKIIANNARMKIILHTEPYKPENSAGRYSAVGTHRKITVKQDLLSSCYSKKITTRHE